MNTLFGDYELKVGDKLVEFNDGTGFSVLSDYPENSYEGKKMLIKVAKSKKNSEAIVGSVNMVQFKDEEGIGYPIVDDQGPDFKVANYSFNSDEGIRFESKSKTFVYNNNSQRFSITEFIDVLAYNHLSLRPPSKFTERVLPHWFLAFIFWLADLSYEKDAGLDELMGDGVDEKKAKFVGKDPDSEPFFKYVKVSKNLLLASLFIALLILTLVIKRYVPDIFTKDISSWFLAMVAVSSLLVLEKLYALLASAIVDFKNRKKNWIHYLHARKFGWYGKSFELIWKKF